MAKKGKGGKYTHTRGPFCSIPDRARVTKSNIKKAEGLKHQKEIANFPRSRAGKITHRNDPERIKVKINEKGENIQNLVPKKTEDNDDDENKDDNMDTAKADNNSSNSKEIELSADDPRAHVFGKKMRQKLDRLIEMGDFFINCPDKSVFDLLKTNREGVEVALANVFDEGKLRARFPNMGCDCKYFSSGKFEIVYKLSKERIPVVQILRKNAIK